MYHICSLSVTSFASLAQEMLTTYMKESGAFLCNLIFNGKVWTPCVVK